MDGETAPEVVSLGRKEIKRKLDYAQRDLVAGQVLIAECAKAYESAHPELTLQLISILEAQMMVTKLVETFNTSV